MLSDYIPIAPLLFALTSATLPRGRYPPFQLLNPLLPREPQSGEICLGINCGNVCVPRGYHCCSDGGAGCEAGTYCVPNGCCPNGRVCDGGGGTLTYPGPPPSLSFTTTTSPAYTGGAPVNPDTISSSSATAPASAGGGVTNSNTISSGNSLESFLATAFPSTGSAGAGGAAATSSSPGFVLFTTSAQVGGAAPTSPESGFGETFLSSTIPSSTGPVAGGSTGSSSGSGGSSSEQPKSGAESVSRSVVLSGIILLAGLVVVQWL